MDLSPRSIANKAIRLAREWQEAQHHTSQNQLQSITRQRHLRRLVGTIDVFTDAAWRSTDRVAGVVRVNLKHGRLVQDKIVGQPFSVC
ncbi:hypothetical protein IGI04_018871 [Brassica rapa subsp. trilocularis]|uniref:BnaA05g14210D protein n=4 Tax=Brassica TaxID=3705 RepID=A0A078GH91_BRANA|nr:hypothetical protein IGI04_018871 [Brassica rapa subsp. trilocularis]KAH0849561.1 hypothetical protein HID58_096285 [Brassica napus]CAG7875335.1 unnamed protein product [Brassica rapa]KAH0852511.1 hypothetical protein HID58_093894 [Brassica napus]CAF2097296.1 unnamed protein product [Brassica napus]